MKNPVVRAIAGALLGVLIAAAFTGLYTVVMLILIVYACKRGGWWVIPIACLGVPVAMLGVLAVMRARDPFVRGLAAASFGPTAVILIWTAFSGKTC